MVERVISESPWKRTRIFLLSEYEAAVIIEVRPEGHQDWSQIQGFLLSKDAAYAAHDLFQDWPEKF